MRAFAILAALTLLQPSAYLLAQEDLNTETGVKPYGVYQQGNIDRINAMNGALAVDIPIISYPQRGGKLKLDLVLHYENRGNYTDPTYNDDGSFAGAAGTLAFEHGFSIREANTPVLFGSQTNDNNVYEGLDAYVLTSDGGSHPMVLTNTTGLETTTPTEWRSADGSGFRALIGSGTYNIPLSPGPLAAPYYDSDGTLYSGFDTVPGPQLADASTDSDIYIPALREDVNGNKITYSSTSGWLDTIGRPIPVPISTNVPSQCPGATSAWLWNLPGLNGGLYPITMCMTTVSETANYFQDSEPLQLYSYTSTQLQSILLPNGTQWKFSYTSDGYGDLKQITFPVGGTISYTWGSVIFIATHGYQFPRNVLSRTSNPVEGAASVSYYNYNNQLTYSSSTGAGGYAETTITDGASNDNVHTFYPRNNLLYVSLYEGQNQSYQGTTLNGGTRTLLQTNSKDYYDFDFQYYSFETSFLKDVITSWPNGQQSKVAFQYDANVTYYRPLFVLGGSYPLVDGTAYTSTLGKETSRTESDYGNGSPGSTLQTTNTTYMALSGPNASSYLANNLLDIPYTVQMLDATGTQASLMQFNYDESSLSSSGLTASTSFDTAPPAGAYRGNNTSTGRWLNTGTLTCPNGNSGGTSGMVTSRKVYYDAGTLASSSEPCGNTTTYAYSLTYQGSYPTTVTNAKNQPTGYTYDFNTGHTTSVTNANSQTTIYSYDGSLRPWTISYPDGGQTTFCYSDTSSSICSGAVVSPSVLITGKQSVAASQQAEIDVDGFGRQIERRVLSDPEGVDLTDTVYDLAGRVQSVSNPYRNISDPTYGLTSYQYDGLGRKTLQINPDDSVTSPSRKSWSYTGNTVTLTDELGNIWKQVSDPLGRFVQANEPGSLITNYTYDGLGNLSAVSQLGNAGNGDIARTRSFTYDSLSRLICAANPENSQNPCPVSATATLPSGVSAYSYDPNSNVQTKTTPAPNSAPGSAQTVTTTYAYDALNRLTAKNYLNDPNATPTTCFLYDTYGGSSLANAIGLLTAEWTQNVPCPGNATSLPTVGFLTAKIFTSYDAMGRLLTQQTCVVTNCTQNTYRSQSFTHDLAGNLTGFSDGWGLQSFTQSYDAAGRLQFLTSSWSDPTHPPILYGVQNYGPIGAVNATMGNGLTITKGYDSRKRVVNMTVQGVR